MTHLPKQEEIMAINNDLSAFARGNGTEIALLWSKKMCLFLTFLSNFSQELLFLSIQVEVSSISSKVQPAAVKY